MRVSSPSLLSPTRAGPPVRLCLGQGLLLSRGGRCVGCGPSSPAGFHPASSLGDNPAAQQGRALGVGTSGMIFLEGREGEQFGHKEKYSLLSVTFIL